MLLLVGWLWHLICPSPPSRALSRGHSMTHMRVSVGRDLGSVAIIFSSHIHRVELEGVWSICPSILAKTLSNMNLELDIQVSTMESG